MGLEMLAALAFGVGESCSRFLDLDLPAVQLIHRRFPERRLGNEGFETGLCVGGAPAALDDGFVHAIALCTHDTPSYTLAPGFEVQIETDGWQRSGRLSIQTGRGTTQAYTAMKVTDAAVSTNKCQTA
jgi:hypothetical protein